MAIPSVTYSFSNGSVASAPDVNTNFQDILNAISDGTGDLSFNTLTLTSTLTANGNVTLGNAAGDTLTVNATPTFVAATTFSSTTTFNGAPTFNAAVTVGAYDFTVNTSVFHVDASNDRVGIGTTSPGQALTLSKTATSGTLCDVAIVSGNNSSSLLYFGDSDNATIANLRYDHGSGVFNFQSSQSGSTVTIMSLLNGGNVGIGTTSPSAPLEISGAANSTGVISAVPTALSNGQSYTGFNTRDAGNSLLSGIGAIKQSGFLEAGYAIFRRTLGGASYFWVSSTGNLLTTGNINDVGTNTGTVVGTQTSDERLKKDIEVIPYGLNEVLNLKPIKYQLNGKTEIGFGAQTTQPIIPEAVYNTGDLLDPNDENSPLDKLSMEYVRIVPVLTKAIQELKAENDALKARVDALESA